MTSLLNTSKRAAVAIAGAVVVATVVAVSIYKHSASSKTEASLEDGPAQSQLPPGSFKPTEEQWTSLHIEPVKAQDFQGQQVTDGAIATNDNATVNVFSPFSGRVARVYAKFGDTVKQGDKLMTVEASEFVQGQNDLIAAKAALSTALAQLRQAEKNENRQHELYLAKAGALKDWQQAQADLAAVQSSARSANIALAAVRNRLRILGKSDREIAVLENQPDAQHMQAEAVVVAPITGTVVQRQVGQGQFIQSASGGAANPVFSIADLSSVWLIANLREADVGTVKPGQQVEVHVPAYPDRVFKAKVTFVSPVVDPNTHRVPVRAEIDNRDGALKPAMVATFAIFTGNAASAPAVPQSAVVYEGSSARVFVALPDGTVQARTVQLGRQNADQIEVLAGLKVGENVVTSGSLFIDRAAKGNQA